jgi:LAO/AO transport system kinase
MVRVLEATGADLVIVETVGVGQIELDIAALADTTVVVVTPGWGDAIQANKAGVLEVADVFVVNKADRPGTADAVRDLDHMLDLDSSRTTRRPPIVRTVATTAEGIADLREAIESHRAQLDATGERDLRRRRRDRAELRALVERVFARAIDDALGEHADIVDAVSARTRAPTGAARDLAPRVRPPSPPGPRRASSPRPRRSP